MQFARLIPKRTLNDLENNDIVTSAFTEEIRKHFPEVLNLVVDIFYEPEESEEQNQKDIDSQIFQIFKKKAQGKFDADYISIF